MRSPNRALVASLAAEESWARTPDRAARTAPARAAANKALDDRLVATYDLDPSRPEFEQRLEHARRAHFKRMALKRRRGSTKRVRP